MVTQMGDKVAEIDEAFKAKEAELKQLRSRLEKLRKSQDLLERRERFELAAVWAVVRDREKVRGLRACDFGGGGGPGGGDAEGGCVWGSARQTDGGRRLQQTLTSQPAN